MSIEYDSPRVIGPPHPMPTEQEFRDAYKRAYVARIVERGIHPEGAEYCWDAVEFDQIRDIPPAEAADEEMSYWDGDPP